MPHQLAVAEAGRQGVEHDARLAGGRHGGGEGADGEDLEELGDVVAVCLVGG